jgi:dihydropteroate synthase
MKPRKLFDLEICGRKIRLGERTLVMGVVNVTPDSFSDGGLYMDTEHAIERGIKLAHQGADWIDVGGESTRPGSKPVPLDEELRRVLLVIRGLKWKLPSLVISIDTTKAEVAEEAVRAGASVINDVSGLSFDPKVAEVARQFRTPLILMHMRGRPATMQRGPFARSIRQALEAGLKRSIHRALFSGVRRSQLIVDPGLGFGKTRRQNFEILGGLSWLAKFGLPILVGSSRKSFVAAVTAGEGIDASRGKKGASRRLGREAKPKNAASSQELQSGDAAAVTASILGGAHIVRVHDVAGLLPAVRFSDAVLAAIG